MLTLTTDAIQAVQYLTADSPEAGLRISQKSADGESVQLGTEIAEHPLPNDQVIEQDGCRVFVEGVVAPRLEQRTLDVQPMGEDPKYVRFMLM